MSYTKGPWFFDTETRPDEICTIHGLSKLDTDGQGWGYIRGEIGYWDADENEKMANVNLIVAAPDLYEALKEVTEATNITPELWIQIHRAILKAEGKQ